MLLHHHAFPPPSRLFQTIVSQFLLHHTPGLDVLRGSLLLRGGCVGTNPFAESHLVSLLGQKKVLRPRRCRKKCRLRDQLEVVLPMLLFLHPRRCRKKCRLRDQLEVVLPMLLFHFAAHGWICQQHFFQKCQFHSKTFSIKSANFSIFICNINKSKKTNIFQFFII